MPRIPRRRTATPLVAALLLLLAPGVPAAAQEATLAAAPTAATSATPSPVVVGVPRDECFPLERLPAALRPRAEKMLLTLLDSEALYTVVGGVKPMSSGFGEYKLRTDKIDGDGLNALEEARQIVAVFRCGDAVSAAILPFNAVYQNERYFDAVVFGRAAFRRMVYQYPAFWSPYGVTPSTEMLSAAQSVENDPTPARNRGLGYLYGYPKYAVDFFVTSAEDQLRTKKLTPRDFVHLPVFSGRQGRFTYAVPKGHQENEEDRVLRAKVERIFAAYKERRARYIGEGKPGPAALLRDWFDDGSGRCAPENARF